MNYSKSMKVITIICISTISVFGIFYAMQQQTKPVENQNIILYTAGVIPIGIATLTPKQYESSDYFKALAQSSFEDKNKYTFTKETPQEAIVFIVDYFQNYGTINQEKIEQKILKDKNLLSVYRIANELQIVPLVEFIENNLVYNPSLAKLLTESSDLQARIDQFKAHPKLFDWNNPIVKKPEDLTNPSATKLQLSNNGRYIAFVRQQKKVTNLHVLDIINDQKIFNVTIENGPRELQFSDDNTFLRVENKIYLLAEKQIITLKALNYYSCSYANNIKNSDLVTIVTEHRLFIPGSFNTFFSYEINIVRIPSLEAVKNFQFTPQQDWDLLYSTPKTAKYYVLIKTLTNGHQVKIYGDNYEWELPRQPDNWQTLKIINDQYFSCIDGGLYIFDIENKKQILALSQVQNCVFSNTYKYFIAIGTHKSSTKKKEAYIWTLTDNPQRLDTEILEPIVDDALFSKLDNYCAIRNDSGNFKIYRRENPNKFSFIYENRTSTSGITRKKSFIFTDDEKYFATTTDEKTFVIIDLATKQQIISLDEKQTIRELRFTEDHKHFIVLLNDGTYKIYSYPTQTIEVPEKTMTFEEFMDTGKKRERPNEEEEEEIPKKVNRLEDIIE